MIATRPYDDYSAYAVLSRLDAYDQIEAELTRGAAVSGLSLFAEWRAIEAARLASWVAFTGAGNPFAVVGIVHTGQAGVGAAAMLAREHAQFRRPLAELAVLIRRQLPAYAEKTGLRRLEARAWLQHPTACDMLSAIGFQAEAVMKGFGQDGRAEFVQFAWISNALPGNEDQALPDPPAQERIEPCASSRHPR